MNGKATGPENIHSEVIKVIAEQEGLGLEKHSSIFSSIYTTEQIISDCLKITPKMTNASQSDNYRMISLMSHADKIFLPIIHTRIYKNVDNIHSSDLDLVRRKH